MKIQSFYYSIASSSSSLTLASASFGFSGMTMPFQTTSFTVIKLSGVIISYQQEWVTVGLVGHYYFAHFWCANCHANQFDLHLFNKHLK